MTAADAAVWRSLWTDYLAFYETDVPEEVYAATFAHILAGGPGQIGARLAIADGRAVGLVHFLFHRSSWVAEEVCYLQDLFTLPEARGMGVGRALIETVYRAADAAGCPTVYWFTQEGNATARRLYDRIGVATPFIRYDRPRPHVTPPPPVGVTVRPVTAADAPAWRALWRDYLAFYAAALPETVTDATFARLCAADPDEMRGRVAEVAGRPVGFVHHVAHRSCWRLEKVCYLQDLYATPEVRGRGIGRSLIEAVYAAADRAGTPSVYWLTQAGNATARRLYDRVGRLTPFIEYDRPA